MYTITYNYKGCLGTVTNLTEDGKKFILNLLTKWAIKYNYPIANVTITHKS